MIKQNKVLLDSDGCNLTVFPELEAQYSPFELLNDFYLQQERIQLFGKEIDQPRLSRLFGDPDLAYAYSGKRFIAIPWNGFLSDLKQRMEDLSDHKFNSALVNYYRNGADSMGLHADNERELGHSPLIVSVSYGTSRKMVFRKNNSKEKLDLELHHGDVLIMSGETQHKWKHEIPKQKKIEESRLNVTFRKIVR
jgi:alkylated DNA repair dioxygenase AlkB